MLLTEDEVRSFNAYQELGLMHPFTCPQAHPEADRELVARKDGLVCPSCDRRQNWAHPWMLNWAWTTSAAAQWRWLPESSRELLRPHIEPDLLARIEGMIQQFPGDTGSSQ